MDNDERVAVPAVRGVVQRQQQQPDLAGSYPTAYEIGRARSYSHEDPEEWWAKKREEHGNADSLQMPSLAHVQQEKYATSTHPKTMHGDVQPGRKKRSRTKLPENFSFVVDLGSRINITGRRTAR